ncbi:hypothetical protein RvY_09116-2 [Ramazzottius varieornatus]|uniref:Uncharacterized protein n=1 Tax=Ramazzottius varieornatus TaxID=947166 RepID=A0A1D1VG64_RAMVA|nr:hypothetical protein RvY_09116-2 [Ramazzottius varieornatus]
MCSSPFRSRYATPWKREDRGWCAFILSYTGLERLTLDVFDCFGKVFAVWSNLQCVLHVAVPSSTSCADVLPTRQGTESFTRRDHSHTTQRYFVHTLLRIPGTRA